MKELISVIVPVYNVAAFLDRCLTSLLNQTYKNLEIILVNDGSTDGSGDICERYQRCNELIKVIHQENSGLSSARNTGIRAASGQYVAFLDSDDWVSNDMIEYLHCLLVDSDADISTAAHVRCTSMGEGERLVSKQPAAEVKVYSQYEYMKKFMKVDSQTIEYYAWNKLYKRALLDELQYPEGLTSEDVVGTFKALLRAKKIVQSTKVTCFYYFNPNGITADFSMRKATDLLNIWDLVVELSKSDRTYYEWAILNRKRIDFAVLFQISIAFSFKKLIENQGFISELKGRLKRNKKELLATNMSMSRKIALSLFCWNYDLAAKLIHLASGYLRFFR